MFLNVLLFNRITSSRHLKKGENFIIYIYIFNKDFLFYIPAVPMFNHIQSRFEKIQS